MNYFSGDIRAEMGANMRMPYAAWAWEYLRRNGAYIRDYDAARPCLVKGTQLATGARLIRDRRRWLAAEKWGLLTFADPALSALKTDVFWSPELLAGALPIRLFAPGQAPDIVHDEIVVSAIETRRTLLDTVDGARHILLNGPRFWVQLYCQHPEALGDYGAVAVSIEGG